jgi:hypothetical protein
MFLLEFPPALPGPFLHVLSPPEAFLGGSERQVGALHAGLGGGDSGVTARSSLGQFPGWHGPPQSGDVRPVGRSYAVHAQTVRRRLAPVT